MQRLVINILFSEGHRTRPKRLKTQILSWLAHYRHRRPVLDAALLRNSSESFLRQQWQAIMSGLANSSSSLIIGLQVKATLLRSSRLRSRSSIKLGLLVGGCFPCGVVECFAGCRAAFYLDISSSVASGQSVSWVADLCSKGCRCRKS